jgi:hypothetical protein
MTRNHIDLKNEFDNSWEKQVGIPYERWLEAEVQRIEVTKEEYAKLAEHMSLEANKLAWKLKRVFGVTSSDGLLPCPLCGKYPEIQHDAEGDKYGRTTGYLVFCDGASHSCTAGAFLTKQEAINEWNKRIKGE